MNVRPLRLAALALALALVGGCASTPKTIPAVEQARAELQAAQNDPDAQRHASKEIQEASRLLTSAEAAARERKDLSAISHLAYLSARTSRIARETGKAKQAEERLAQSGAERERIRLAARTREVELARSAAVVAQSAARQAQSEARQAQTAAAEAGSQLALEQQRRAELEQEMEELAAKRSDRGLVITLGDVLFDTGKAELKSGADRQLAAIATFLSEHPERHVLIEGFTDSVGPEEYNRDLSRRRAEAVRSTMLARGVPADRIDVQGYGEEFPVGTNADAGGRQLNRRVEVIVSNDANPVEPRARL